MHREIGNKGHNKRGTFAGVDFRVVWAEDQRLHLVEYQSGIMW